MVATCCKPSSGAGGVCLETTLERQGLTPSHEEWQPPQGDPTEELLYQGAEMPEERKPEESLCTERSGATLLFEPMTTASHNFP